MKITQYVCTKSKPAHLEFINFATFKVISFVSQFELVRFSLSLYKVSTTLASVPTPLALPVYTTTSEGISGAYENLTFNIKQKLFLNPILIHWYYSLHLLHSPISSKLFCLWSSRIVSYWSSVTTRGNLN